MRPPRLGPRRAHQPDALLPTGLLELADPALDLDRAGPFTVRQFRDATGVGRNVVIEVLEHFDGKTFTRRVGDMVRVVGERRAVAQ